jgi:putative transposase
VTGEICTRWNEREFTWRKSGSSTPQACKEAEITVQTFYRWRKEYGGLKMDQAKRMKELEKENGKLKRLVAELALDKQILKDIAEGNF